jgi:hypothetical protein
MGRAVGVVYAGSESVIQGIIGNARQGRNGGVDSRAAQKYKEENP